MADSGKITVEIPKTVVAQALAKKPTWMPITDEEFLARMIAKGNYDGFFKQIDEAALHLEAVRLEVAEKLKHIEQTVGTPVNFAQYPAKKRKKREVIASQAKPITAEKTKI